MYRGGGDLNAGPTVDRQAIEQGMYPWQNPQWDGMSPGNNGVEGGGNSLIERLFTAAPMSATLVYSEPPSPISTATVSKVCSNPTWFVWCKYYGRLSRGSLPDLVS
jgi:hypothetical protein